MNGIEIISTGYAKIEKTLDNAQLEKMVETSNEWILSRTGIQRRHISSRSSALLAIEAAKKATQNQDLSKLSLIIVATMTPENKTPSNACLVQKALDLNEQAMICFDINAACSGYVYALKVAQSLLQEGQYGLIIGSEQLSSIIDYQDRNTCILFGDGAAATLIQKNNNIFYSYLDSAGNREVLYANDYLKMKGQEVFKFAIQTIPQSIDHVLNQAKMTLEEIDYVVCHQANERIIKHVNTSAASIPLALAEMNEKGILKKGMKIILVGFGGGLTWGALLMEW